MKLKGQNIGEYGIAFGLIVVVSIAILGLIGSNVSDLFTGSIKKKSPAQSASATSNSGAPAVALASGNLPFSNLPGKLVQVDLGDGKSLRLSYADPVAVAEAAGGNGVTENALAVLEQTIAQLREQGEDEAKIAELEKLAMAGHQIKDLQKLFESKFPPKGFANNQEKYDFLLDSANSIEIDGKRMTLMEAAPLLNGSTLGSSILKLTSCNGEKVNTCYGAYDTYLRRNDLVQSNDSELFALMKDAYFAQDNFEITFNASASGPIGKFVQQLRKVESTGLFSNPALKSLIRDDLSRQIYNSSFQTYMVPTKADVGALVEVTRTNSNDICTASNAVSCQDRSG